MQPPVQTHHDDMQARRNLIAAIIYQCIHDATYAGYCAESLTYKWQADVALRGPSRLIRHYCSLIGLDADDLRDRYLRGDLTADDFWSATHTRGRAA